MKWVNEFLKLHFPLRWKDTDLEKAYELKDANLPKLIYKYRSINKNSLKNLKEDTVWLADPESFNDPYDCSHTTDFGILNKNDSIKVFKKYLTDPLIDISLPKDIEKQLLASDQPFDDLNNYLLRNEPKEKQDVINHLLKKVAEERNKKLTQEASKGFSKLYKLCAFSETNNSMLMWAHYADYHKGFCIEYDIQNLSKSDSIRRYLYPVVYSKKMFNATKYFKLDREYDEVNNLYIFKSALIKAKDWKYEKEWRLLFTGDIRDDARPYKMKGIKALYLGVNIDLPSQAVLLSICKEKGIKVFKMNTSHDTFDLISYEIDT